MIHVIGAGGTGGWLIPTLVKMVNPMNITVFDGDRVEDKNIIRQNFRKDDVGEAKAILVAERYNLGQCVVQYFEEKHLVEIQNGDTVIICVDNFDTRAMISDYAETLHHITVINAGNELITTSTQVYVKRDGIEFTPRITYMHPEIARGMSATELACAEVAILPGGEQTVAANILSAALALMALTVVAKWDASPLRADARPPFRWHEFHTDMERGNAASVDWREDGVGEWRTIK